jgi:YD repeat-containing protein
MMIRSGAIVPLFNGKRIRMTLQTCIGLFALAAPLCMAQGAQSKAAVPPAPSDREKAELRGPVKSCVEETTYPAATGSNGLPAVPYTRWSEMDYDEQGHMLARLDRNPDGSVWTVRNTYDASGKLIKTTSGKEGGAAKATNYAYDERGRLTSITKDGAAPVTFHYDEQGLKTKVQTSRAEDYRANVGTAGSPFEAADRPPNLPGGGTATTKYDENDRPTEIEVRNAQGEAVSRALRVYDQQGNVKEEKQILDDPISIFPAEVRAGIASEPSQADALRAQLSQAMGGHEGISSVGYTYDTQGRITERTRQFFNQVERVETTYNERGDVAGEKRLSTQEGEKEQPPQSPETRFTYHYDQHGNWTEKITLQSTSARGAFEPSDSTRRTLTYF